MKRRTWLIAVVSAEIKFKTAVDRFDKEFSNGNQNQQGRSASGGQNNNAQGNVPAQQPVQQPQYGGGRSTGGGAGNESGGYPS